MTRKTALLTGVTCQDGAYVAEFLLKKGYEVRGKRRISSGCAGVSDGDSLEVVRSDGDGHSGPARCRGRIGPAGGREGCGGTFAPGNAASFADAVVRLAGAPALYERCRANAERAAQRYDRRRLARDMLCVLTSVAERAALRTRDWSGSAIEPS